MSLRYCLRWLASEWRRIVALVLLSIGLALSEGVSVTLLIPVLDTAAVPDVFKKIPVLRTFLEWIFAIPPSDRLLVLTILLAVAVTLRGVMQFGSQFLATQIPLRLREKISARSYAALVDADLAYMPDHDRGQLQTMLISHPERAGSVANGLLNVLVSLSLIAVFGTLMLAVSWQMTLAAIVFIALAYILMKAVTQPWFVWAGERMTRVVAELNSGALESIHGLVLIKLRGAETLMKARFDGLLRKFHHVETRRMFFAELQSPLLGTVSGLFICGLLVLAVSLYGTADRSWVGTFIFFVLCLYRLIAPAGRLITAQGMIAAHMHAFAETDKFVVEAERSRLPNGNVPFERFRDKIRIEHATLVYEKARGPALVDADIEIGRGEIVALVGASGAGKTTVLTLLMRLRDPTSGRVVLDGRDLREYDVRTWRRRIAAVSQDIVFFNDTVRNNLTFGLSGISDEAIWAALRDASADTVVRDLPGTLDAHVGDGASKLSGGQRQRLALARALLSQPDLLILDEATSHLDSLTEVSVQKAIDASRANRAVLIVAHRLSTVRQADRIYVLNNGRVIEQGTHQDLYASDNQYRRLFDAQHASDEDMPRASSLAGEAAQAKVELPV